MNRNLQRQWSEQCRTRHGSVQLFFEQRLPELCRDIEALPTDITIVFAITGPEAGCWVLEVGRDVRVRRGTHAWPDCRIQLSSIVFRELIAGQYSGREAFLSGALVVQGDVGLGLMLEAAWHQESLSKRSG